MCKKKFRVKQYKKYTDSVKKSFKNCVKNLKISVLKYYCVKNESKKKLK